MVYGWYDINVWDHILIVVHLIEVWRMDDALDLVPDVWDDIIETFVMMLGWYIDGWDTWLWHLVHGRGISRVICHLFEAHGWHVDNVIGTLRKAFVDDPDICLIHFLAHILCIYTLVMRYYYMVMMCIVCTWYATRCTWLMFCSCFSIHSWHIFFLHEVWYGMSLMHGQVQGSS
jgi:hypothetical protein